MPTHTAPAWGKLSLDRKQRHPLNDHSLDVATVLRALLDYPNVARWAQTLTPAQKDRLAVIAYLHDFGKCNAGFQAKADPEAQDIAGHVLEGASLLIELKESWPPEWERLMQDLACWFGEEGAMQMLLAALSHHGRPLSIDDYKASSLPRTAKRYWSVRAGYDPLQALADLAKAARLAYPAAFAPETPEILATPTLQQRFAGLLMLADWIASDPTFFPFRQNQEEDRRNTARHSCEQALIRIGLSSPKARASKSFAEVFGFAPSPLQGFLRNDLTPDEPTRLVLIEADTGVGKTEAALAWFFRLYEEHRVDGLYFALPTRVAARELYARVLRAITTAFPENARPSPVLLAAPGYVKADGQPVLVEPIKTLWDDAPDARREVYWSAERPKRFLAAPIAVGTIDQALLSALKVKHSLLRSVCLDRHLLVVDEVHASDPYMAEILHRLLEGHLARGGWALLLSATLGEVAASKYLKRTPLPMKEAIQRPYPAISTRGHIHSLVPARNRQITLELSQDLDDTAAPLPRLIQALEQGARVLVICNTVTRANALLRCLEEALERQHPHLLSALFTVNGQRCPHHGRFAREDREILDAEVTHQLGKGSPAGPKLIIGTQTLEQSLDIDADWLVTDLAPMDVLIQRFGRLHRHARPRPPGFAQPRAWVRLPAQDLSNYLKTNGELDAPAGLGRVYSDGRVVACTMTLLKTHPVIRLPDQARYLIEHSTHTEAFATLPQAWQRHAHNIIGKTLSEIRQALTSTLDDEPFGELHYGDKSERIVTRLGDMTYELPLSEPQTSPFAARLEQIGIPARWLKQCAHPDKAMITVEESSPASLRMYVCGQHFKYTRFGLELEDNDVRSAR